MFSGKKNDFKMIKDINDGEIIFSKNNVCMHLNKPIYKKKLSNSCDINCIPGYFYIKINNFKNNQENSLENFYCNLKKNDLKENNLKNVNPSMLITWIPNIIFLEKSLKKTKSNISFSLRKSKSLNCLSKFTSYEKCFKRRRYSLESKQNINKEENFYNEENFNEKNLLFSIDVKEINSIKLFFDLTLENFQNNNFLIDISNKQNELKDEKSFLDLSNEIGQLVIINNKLEHKILHFHNGGLNKLKNFFTNWDLIFCCKKIKTEKNFLSYFNYDYFQMLHLFNKTLCDFFIIKFIQYNNFKKINQFDNQLLSYTINLTALKYIIYLSDLTSFEPLSIKNKDDYNNFFDAEGCLKIDYNEFKTKVFFFGIDQNARKYFWPYLLRRFLPTSTDQIKNRIIKISFLIYHEINQNRLNMNNIEKDEFYRKYQCVIEKDVPRTDRMNPAFSNKNNKKVKNMETILNNYAFYNKKVGYTQGMSDLLAPLVVSIEPESEAFFNFMFLLEKDNFYCLPNDNSIDTCMARIRELLRVLSIEYYNYFIQQGDECSELLFAHRWMLLCFKREFNENFALRIWECCWTELETDFFQYFICIAIIKIYGEEIIKKKMNSDDILFYFGGLSQKMDGETVLHKAYSLLFEFRSISKLPCTLKSICNFEYINSNFSERSQPFFECIYFTENIDAKLLCSCEKS